MNVLIFSLTSTHWFQSAIIITLLEVLSQNDWTFRERLLTYWHSDELFSSSLNQRLALKPCYSRRKAAQKTAKRPPTVSFHLRRFVNYRTYISATAYIGTLQLNLVCYPNVVQQPLWLNQDAEVVRKLAPYITYNLDDNDSDVTTKLKNVNTSTLKSVCYSKFSQSTNRVPSKLSHTIPHQLNTAHHRDTIIVIFSLKSVHVIQIRSNHFNSLRFNRAESHTRLDPYQLWSTTFNQSLFHFISNISRRYFNVYKRRLSRTYKPQWSHPPKPVRR